MTTATTDAGLRELAARAGLAGAALVRQSATGLVVAVTAEAAAVLGLAVDHLTGHTSQNAEWAAVDEHGDPLGVADHPSMLALARRAVVRDVVVGVHRRDLGAAGQHVWLRVSSVPLAAADGGGVLTELVEVTGAAARELRLAESERMFRFLAESANDLVAWQLADTTFVWVSPAAHALLGRAPQDLVGTRALDLLHPDDAERAVAATTAAVARGEGAEQVTVRVRHAAGHWVWAEVTGSIIRDAAGGATHLRTAWRDVSSRVRAERDRDAALRLAGSVIDGSPIGVAVSELDGTVIRVNLALCRMLDQPAEQLLGRSVVALTHPDDLPATDPRGVGALLAGSVAVHESERRYLRRDGTFLWGHRTAVLLHDEHGGPRHVLAQLQDVTQRRTAVDELARRALTDPLTGLVNRTVFLDRLGHTLGDADGRGGHGVLFVDLDHFKPVNDTLGHDAGDELLRQVAARLSAAVRDGDLVARLGGDEFAVLCHHVQDRAAAVAQRVVDAIAAPFALGAQQVTISASVGVTLTRAEDAAATDVVARADSAMYAAKQAGRGRVAAGATVRLCVPDRSADRAVASAEETA